MQAPDWRKFNLNDGIVPEPGLDDKRLVLWLPGAPDDHGRLWERIGNVPGADIATEQGLSATPATAIQARQRVLSFFGKWLQRFCDRSDKKQTWMLPSGEAAEQHGARQTDLLLVWSADEKTVLDEPRIRECWPESQRVRQLGPNLFLVSGIERRQAETPTAPTVLSGELPQQAELLLAAARAAGDRSREALALADLGVAYARKGEAARAIPPLEEALTIVRHLGDRSRESDVVGNLGLAVLATAQPGRALELFQQALTLAQEAGDRFEEKNALERLGHAFSHMRRPVQAQELYQQALVIARDVGDRSQEADLLWYLAIQEAEQGRQDSALAQGQAAIDLLRKLGSPAAVALTDHLHKYRLGEASMVPGGNGLSTTALVGGSILAGNWGPIARPGAAQSASGPGLLRMGISLAKSMGKFIGSGGATVRNEIHQQRMRTCAACPHHTGIRCRLCGCFTNIKAWLPHEHCPIGKW